MGTRQWFQWGEAADPLLCNAPQRFVESRADGCLLLVLETHPVHWSHSVFCGSSGVQPARIVVSSNTKRSRDTIGEATVKCDLFQKSLCWLPAPWKSSSVEPASNWHRSALKAVSIEHLRGLEVFSNFRPQIWGNPKTASTHLSPPSIWRTACSRHLRLTSKSVYAASCAPDCRESIHPWVSKLKDQAGNPSLSALLAGALVRFTFLVHVGSSELWERWCSVTLSAHLDNSPASVCRSSVKAGSYQTPWFRPLFFGS